MGSTTPRIVKRAQRMVDHLNEVTSTPNHFSVPVIELVVSLYPCLSFSLSLSSSECECKHKISFHGVKKRVGQSTIFQRKERIQFNAFSTLSSLCLLSSFFFVFLYIFYSRSAGA